MRRIKIEFDEKTVKKHGVSFTIIDMVCMACWRTIKAHDEVILGKPPLDLWLMCKGCHEKRVGPKSSKRSVKAILKDYDDAVKRRKRVMKREREKEYAH